MTSDAQSPLDGVKVIELTSIYSGPMAGMMMAELGADVVKVESPDGPDTIRTSGLAAGPDSVNSTFYALNRGKRFCAIDAKTDRGRALLADMVAEADVLLHNMRPGKPEELGIGWEAMSARNPRLIYAAISGVGNEGPEAHLPVYDYVMQAKIGMVDHQRDLSTGTSDLVHQVVIDKTSANALVQGILAALFMRERTGRGQRVDVPMIAAGLAFFWPDGFAPVHAETTPVIPLDQMPPWLEAAPSSFLVVLPTADGEIATGILLPPWDGLCIALDRVDWVTDERFVDQVQRIFNLPALIEEVSGEVAKYTTEEVLARLAEHDFAAGAVAKRRDVFDDPTIDHLGLVTEQDVPGVGVVRQPAPMWTFSGADTERTTSIGFTGAHSAEVLAEHGLSADEIEQLMADGIVAVTDGTATM
ncbi:MAG: CaiB/BaiF CoA-transferase family protein [Actinomycetota bacterium]